VFSVSAEEMYTSGFQKCRKRNPVIFDGCRTHHKEFPVPYSRSREYDGVQPVIARKLECYFPLMKIFHISQTSDDFSHDEVAPLMRMAAVVSATEPGVIDYTRKQTGARLRQAVVESEKAIQDIELKRNDSSGTMIQVVLMVVQIK
jgi:hypothetical protein